jgi:hypothetical protein
MDELNAAPQDSPLPSQITPEMANALLRYRQGPAVGALGEGYRALAQPIADAANTATQGLLGDQISDEDRSAAAATALGLVGPMGAGKGLGIAMAAGGAAKKAAPKLADLAAESFRGALKGIPQDDTEKILSAIKDALGGDWDHAANLPKQGSSWEKLDPSNPVAHYGNPGAEAAMEFAKSLPKINKLYIEDIGTIPTAEPSDHFVVANGKQIASLTKTDDGYLLEMPNGVSKEVGSIGEGKLSAMNFHNIANHPDYVGPSSQVGSQDWINNTAKVAEDFLQAHGHATKKQVDMTGDNELITWAKQKGMPGLDDTNWNIKAGKWQQGPVKPSLSDEDIDAKLASNPGMSIFELSGVKNPEPEHIPIDTDTLPRGVTWQLPAEKQAQATEQGYNAFLHHGTRVPTIFDQFKLPDDEIGVHFGSPRAAQEIQGSTLDWSTAPRVYPAAIVAQNPIRLDDIGEWSPGKLARNLIRNGLPQNEVNAAQWKGIAGIEDIDKASRLSAKDMEHTVERTQNLRSYLQNKGYDSIVYKNVVEDKGHDSYILFRESPSSPGHVYGARLPWADFDPGKFTSANIKAGIPLAGATAAYAATHNGKLQEVRDVDHNPFPGDTAGGAK